MSKTKTPFHSFKAHGTIADSVTYQDRNRATMVRRKPIPTDRKTLPQIYHRWLYQDGAALWHTLSLAVKQQWESDARPFRITSFNYFMRTYLTTLPDLLAGYHLDCLSPTTAIDFSKNANNGVIYGAQSVQGLIDKALNFDGIDDKVTIPNTASLNPDQISMMAWVYPVEAKYARIITKHHPTAEDLYGILWRQQRYIWVRLTDDANTQHNLWPTNKTFPLNTWLHIAVTYDGNRIRIYANAELSTLGPVDPFTIGTSTLSLYIAALFGSTEYFNGIIDELRVYNRALSLAEIQRHYERRYPL